MPDLSALFRQNTLTEILAHYFNDAGPRGFHPAIFLRSYVRIVDKALEDYELCRSAFDEYVHRVSNNTLSPLFRAIGHMENCLNSIERALRFVARMGEDTELAGIVPALSVMRTSNRRRLSTLRNAVEHLDERVINNKICEGDFTTLWMDEDHMKLQEVRVGYQEFGGWLTELHTLAITLAKFRPTQTATQSSNPQN